MSLECGNTETYIFMLKTEMLKVVLDFDKGTCTVYDDLEQIILEIKKMTKYRMRMLQKGIKDYIADGKKLKGFPPQGARFL